MESYLATAETRRCFSGIDNSFPASSSLEELARKNPGLQTTYRTQGMNSSFASVETRNRFSAFHTAVSASPPVENFALKYQELWAMCHPESMESSWATAKTRRRISGLRATITTSPPLGGSAMNCKEMQVVYQLHGMESHSAMRYPTVDATAAASMAPRTMRRTSLLSSFVPESGLTDAQVQLVTNDVISAAMAALNGGELRQTSHHASRGDVTSPATPSSRLNAMTERFLERSNARRLQSRPAGIVGSAPSMTL